MRPVSARPAAVAAALLLPALLPAAAAAQARVAAIDLTRPEVEYAEPFSFVSGVRELRDGRVIVTDPREKSIQLVDLAAGRATPIGREGSGPNEYVQPGGVFVMPGDSTIVHDGGNNRFLVLAPDGTPVRTFSTLEGSEPDMRLIFPRTGDAQGNLYFLDRGLRLRLDGPPRDGRGPELPDSGTVVRYDPRTKQATALGKVALPRSTTQTPASSGGARMVMQMSIPFSPQDDWTVGLDGRLAVVRAEPYRVEWVAPNGQRVTGPEIAYTPIRVTEQDKEDLRNSRATLQTMGTRVTVGGGGASVRSGGGPPPANFRPPEPPSWPDVKPAFQANQTLVAPDGRLWVSRHRQADDPAPKYDVFDSFGRLVARATLPAGTRLVGFGARSAYLVRTDDDDLQYLQRYRLF